MKEKQTEVKKPAYAVTLCKGTFAAQTQWMCMKCNKVKNTAFPSGVYFCCGQPMVRLG